MKQAIDEQRDEKREEETRRVNDALNAYSFFKDESGVIYAWIKRKNSEGRKAVRLASKEFRQLVTLLYFSTYHVPPHREFIEQIVGIQEAKLLLDEKIPKFTLCNRFAFIANGTSEILIDKCNDRGEYWRIAKEGVTTELEIHPIFRKRGNQATLEDVDKTGTSEDIKEFVKYFQVQEDDIILLVGAVGAAIIAEIPRVILFLYGVQGALKSSFTKALVQTLDPTAPNTIRLTRDIAELTQALNGRAIPAFDNVSHISEAQSDALCRAVTGEGDTKRELYSDDNDVIKKYMRFIIINGINNVLTGFDAIDRSLAVKLQEVEKGKRRTEKEVRKYLNQMIPKVRGAVWQTWTKALSIVEQVESEHLKDLPRMADFSIFAEAFCRASGYKKDEFFNRYTEAIWDANKVGLESSLLAEILNDIVQSWAKEKTEEEFTPSQLWRMVIAFATEQGYKDRQIEKLLPKSAPQLSKELSKLIVSIKTNGILLERGRTKNNRSWKVERVPTMPSSSSSVTAEKNHAQEPPKTGDSTSPSPVTSTVTADHTQNDRMTGVTGLSEHPSTVVNLCAKCGREIELNPSIIDGKKYHAPCAPYGPPSNK